MSMNFLSLRDETTHTKTFANLFELGDWKIKKAVIISAYTDIESIKEIVKYVSRQADKTSSSLQIYMDKAASRVSTDEKLREELKKLHKEIKKKISKNSGIFLVSYGKLFHSKCYLFEGRKEGKFFIGSMNLTVSGRENNEEILVGASYNCNTKEANARLAEKLFEYADELRDKKRGKVYSVSDIKDYEDKSITFRDIILDGFLYTEFKEIPSFFSIKLNLPDEFKRIKTDIELFGAEYNNSISIEKIIQRDFNINKKGEKEENILWKRFCIETCYGYWSPSAYSKKIQKELNKSGGQKHYYIKVRKLLLSHHQDIKASFLQITDKIKSKVHEFDPTWDFDAEKKWAEGYTRICSKLKNEDFIEKLASGVQKAPALDVWIEPSAAKNFIESFSDFIYYIQEKERSKNRPAKALIDKLGIQEDLNPEGLVKSIEKWMTKNPDSKIFSLKD